MARLIPFITCCTVLFCTACAQTNLQEKLETSLCSDDFNRTDAATFGSAWEINGLNQAPLIYGVSGQKAYAIIPISGWGFFSCAAKMQQSKSVISTRLKLLTTFAGINSVGLIARSQAKDTLTDAYYCGLDTDRLYLYKGVNALRTNLSSSAGTFTFSAGNEYVLTFSLLGNQLTCSVSGSAVDSLSAIDSSYSAGYTGVFMIAGSNLQITFDDFKTEVKP